MADTLTLDSIVHESRPVARTRDSFDIFRQGAQLPTSSRCRIEVGMVERRSFQSTCLDPWTAHLERVRSVGIATRFVRPRIEPLPELLS